MFRSVIIGPVVDRSARLKVALESTRCVQVTRTVDAYPEPLEVVRILRAQGAHILFISFESLPAAQEIVKFLDAESNPVQIVAFNGETDLAVMRETMRIGLREFLVEPFEASSVREALAHLKIRMEQRPVDHATDEIFSFLPSKAGVGASTIALNVSAALARRPNTRVLLSDFDLNSGMIRFMLKLSNTHSVLEAVEHASIMEQELLSQLVSEIDRLEVLHAGPINPNYRIDPGQIRSLISFLRRSYRVLCFDLSGNLERYSLELMQESKRIILVCTAEVPSIHMAREKMRFLKTLDLDGRVMVVLNRSHRKMLFTKNQVEQMLDSGQDCVSQ